MPLSCKKKFYFIRHGETDFNKEKRYTGLFDIPLNKKGIQQVKESLHLLNEQNISVIYSSPLKRALETANIISQYLKIPIIVVNSFKERNFGILQTKKKLSYKKRYFYRGQTLYEHQRNTVKGFNKINSKNNILIVAHSGTYKALHKHILHTSIFKTVNNAFPICFYMNDKRVWNIVELKNKGT